MILPIVCLAIVAFLIYRMVQNYEIRKNNLKFINDIALSQPEVLGANNFPIYFGSARFYINNQKRILVFIDNVGNVFKYDFKAILGAEILIGNQVTQSHKSSLSGAIVGGVLAGGAGAIIGAGNGKTNVNEEINSVTLKVYINNNVNPFWSFQFLSQLTTRSGQPFITANFNAEKALAFLKMAMVSNEESVSQTVLN